MGTLNPIAQNDPVLFFSARLCQSPVMQQAEAILIRRHTWSDTSLITTWLTPHEGKIRLMAKGARRPASPFAGKLDLFFHAEVAYVIGKSTSLHTLREIRLISPFDASRVPCANVFLCGYFAELIDLATESGNPSPEMFDLLKRAIVHLRTESASLRALEHFERELCRVLGVMDEQAHPLAAIETYCGRIPASRAAATRFLAT